MRTAGAIVLAVLVAACSATSSRPVIEYLDERTAVTITRSTMPVLLYRESPSVAAYARNYVDLGPVMVNRMGHRSCYLWLGIWSTMQPAEPERALDGFEVITLIADGEPLTLELAGVTPETIGASRHAYTRPVASAANAYYTVTVDQVRLIAESSEIRLRPSGSERREYGLWDGQQTALHELRAFYALALQ